MKTVVAVAAWKCLNRSPWNSTTGGSASGILVGGVFVTT
jgi:hypothetical protein